MLPVNLSGMRDLKPADLKYQIGQDARDLINHVDLNLTCISHRSAALLSTEPKESCMLSLVFEINHGKQF